MVVITDEPLSTPTPPVHSAEHVTMRIAFVVADECDQQPNLFHRNVIRDFTGYPCCLATGRGRENLMTASPAQLRTLHRRLLGLATILGIVATLTAPGVVSAATATVDHRLTRSDRREQLYDHSPAMGRVAGPGHPAPHQMLEENANTILSPD